MLWEAQIKINFHRAQNQQLFFFQQLLPQSRRYPPETLNWFQEHPLKITRSFRATWSPYVSGHETVTVIPIQFKLNIYLQIFHFFTIYNTARYSVAKMFPFINQSLPLKEQNVINFILLEVFGQRFFTSSRRLYCRVWFIWDHIYYFEFSVYFTASIFDFHTRT